jgi:hypothetical protein
MPNFGGAQGAQPGFQGGMAMPQGFQMGGMGGQQGGFPGMGGQQGGFPGMGGQPGAGQQSQSTFSLTKSGTFGKATYNDKSLGMSSRCVRRNGAWLFSLFSKEVRWICIFLFCDVNLVSFPLPSQPRHAQSVRLIHSFHSMPLVLSNSTPAPPYFYIPRTTAIHDNRDF